MKILIDMIDYKQISELIPIFGFFSFWMGAAIASFLNVVIWRVPRGESIVSPPSHCPNCNTAIRWYQNLPIISWILLGGKCAKCREKISARYIIVEAIGGCLFLSSFLHLVANQKPLYFILVWWIWISLMIVGSFIDFDHQLLPDFTTVGGMILGLLFAIANSCFEGTIYPFVNSLIGLIFGFGLMWIIRWAGTKLFKREAMGLGDVFLMGAVGAICGVSGVLVSLMLSSVFGSIIGVAMIALAKAKFGKFVAIPYGPYICLGCLTHMFFGSRLIDWYLKLLGFN